MKLIAFCYLLAVYMLLPVIGSAYMSKDIQRPALLTLSLGCIAALIVLYCV